MLFAEKIRAQILNGALADHKTYLAGYCRGFYMTFTVDGAGYQLRINASREADPGNAALASFLEQTRLSNKKITGISVLPNRFAVTIHAASFAKKIPELVNGIMEPILNHLTLNGYTSGCGCCGGNAAQVACYQVNSEILYLCDGCAAQMEESLKENQAEVKAQKSKLLPGLVGAFLGALIGCVLWVVIGRLGYIAGIAGLVMGVCAMKGYELMGKYLDKKGVICSIIMLVVMLYFANKFTWALSAYSALKEYDWSFAEVFQSLNWLLSENGLTGSYFLDLGIGYLLTFLSSFGRIRSAFRVSNGSYRVRKLS